MFFLCRKNAIDTGLFEEEKARQGISPPQARTLLRPRRVRAVSATKRQINVTDEQEHRNQRNRPVWRNLPPFLPRKHKNEYRRQLPSLYSPLGRVRASHSTGHGKAASCLLLLGGQKPCTHLLSLKRKVSKETLKQKGASLIER